MATAFSSGNSGRFSAAMAVAERPRAKRRASADFMSIRRSGVAIDAIQVLEAREQTLGRGSLRRGEPRARIVLLLVRRVGSGRVADLSLEVIVVLRLIGADTIPEGPLDIGVDIHLHRAV